MEEETPEEAQADKPKSALEESKEILAQIQTEKAELKEQMDRLESIKSEQLLSGATEAGKAPQTQEETPTEYKDRVMGGEADASEKAKD